MIASTQYPDNTDQSDNNENTPSSPTTNTRVSLRKHSTYDASRMLVLKVEDTLFQVDIRVLKQFEVLKDMFEHASEFNPEKDEGHSEDNPIDLQGVSMFEIESLLHFFDPARILEGTDEIDLQQWSAILHLSTMWSYPKLRERAMTEIEKLNPSLKDYILLSRKCNVPKWLELAYNQLCRRDEPITVEEGLVLGIEVFTRLCHLRELLIRPMSSGIGSCGSCTTLYLVRTCSSCNQPLDHYCACKKCGHSLEDKAAKVQKGIDELMGKSDDIESVKDLEMRIVTLHAYLETIVWYFIWIEY
ncbi:hypothetical protein FRC02_004103 [Tulasnella sp. 418]|nr:hypothetical protein FRC02_004103 [Tulasnella sp. 418]